MHEYKNRMLRQIAHSPRTARDFTESPVHSTVSPGVLQKYLDDLAADGLIFEHDGWYHITAAGILEVDKPTTKAEPRVWCACSTKGSYQPPQWPVRAGGEQHKQFSSRGV